jgi:hypothetical protein
MVGEAPSPRNGLSKELVGLTSVTASDLPRLCCTATTAGERRTGNGCRMQVRKALEVRGGIAERIAVAGGFQTTLITALRR